MKSAFIIFAILIAISFTSSYRCDESYEDGQEIVLIATLSRNGDYITLEWNHSYIPDVILYKLYRSDDGIEYDLYASLDKQNRGVMDKSVDIGRTYRYMISVLNFTDETFSDPLEITNDRDLDKDGLGDHLDDDDDGDGTPDLEDDFPRDQTEQLDTDLDGIGNVEDDDDDNDGYTDKDDDEPLNALNGLVDLSLDISDRLSLLEKNLNTSINSQYENISRRITDLQEVIERDIDSLSKNVTMRLESMLENISIEMDELESEIRYSIELDLEDMNESFRSVARTVLKDNELLKIKINAIEAELKGGNADLYDNVTARIGELKELFKSNLNLINNSLMLLDFSIKNNIGSLSRFFHNHFNRSEIELEGILNRIISMDANKTLDQQNISLIFSDLLAIESALSALIKLDNILLNMSEFKGELIENENSYVDNDHRTNGNMILYILVLSFFFIFIIVINIVVMVKRIRMKEVD